MFFFTFDSDDWFGELTDFYHTDVVLPATVTVDEHTYQDVGTNFRGNTSFQMVAVPKKSLDLAFDFADDEQSLQGVRNLDLLNANGDASLVRQMLHGWLANQFTPAPRTALVRVVIQGEDHGVYVAVQQFDKDFLADHFGSKKGARFKVPPDSGGNGGLRDLGDEIAPYQRSYELKSKDDGKAWQGLIDLCTALENAPTDRGSAACSRSRPGRSATSPTCARWPSPWTKRAWHRGSRDGTTRWRRWSRSTRTRSTAAQHSSVSSRATTRGSSGAAAGRAARRSACFPSSPTPSC